MSTSTVAAGVQVGRNRDAAGRVRRAGRAEPRPYDFRRASKLSRKHLRSLQIVFETFARQWATLLTSSLRTLTQVNLLTVEELTYDEYIARLPNPTMVNVLSVEPLGGVGILELSMTSTMISVDRLLGGAGTGAQPERPLSEIEAGLIRHLVDRILGELRYAFEPIVRLEPAVGSVEYNPQFVQAAAAADIVIVASFDMRVGTDESTATLCLPFADLFPLVELALGLTPAADADGNAPPEPEKYTIEERLQAVPIEVAVGFAPTLLTPGTLVNLAVGDVVSLRHAVNSPLLITAADVTFAHAMAGARGRRLACLVVDEPTGLTSTAAAPGREH